MYASASVPLLVLQHLLHLAIDPRDQRVPPSLFRALLRPYERLGADVVVA